ncbi:MAG: alcohol dehydrogenase catalytic domain-containing protein [Nitrospirae bacterium]|nr:alcohol dehydrogenase catalytic domain-containing protein [Nitrospirota bacterium]
MKVLKARADWSPRKGYTPTDSESSGRKAISGNLLWKNPSFGIVDEPEPEVNADEIIVKVKYCGICGSDTHVYESDTDGYIIFSGPARLPCILGHEYSGEIVEVGRDVSGFKRGDIVTGESIFWCGRCLPCRSGMLNQCENVELMGLTTNGAFAEYIAVKSKYCWDLNSLEERFSKDDVFKIGALIEPLGCAYNGIFISGNGFNPGAYAIVYGAGPIGLGAVLLLKAAGAAKLIVIDVIDKRLEIAKIMGADYVFNLTKADDIEKTLMDITSGWGADIQVEAAGAANKTVPLMQNLSSKRGKIIYLGRAEAMSEMELNKIVSGSHYIIGSRGHSGYGIFPNTIRLIQGGRLNAVSEMITSVFPFSKIMEAFALSTKRTDGKILVKIN